MAFLGKKMIKSLPFLMQKDHFFANNHHEKGTAIDIERYCNHHSIALQPPFYRTATTILLHYNHHSIVLQPTFYCIATNVLLQYSFY